MKSKTLFFIFFFIFCSDFTFGQESEMALGSKYFMEGKYDLAQKVMIGVLSDEKHLLTKPQKISLYTDLGKINTIQGDYSKSLQYLIQAKRNNVGDSLQYSHYNVAFGELFANIGATSLAIEYYKKAYSYAVKGNELGRYFHANTIGCMFLKLNQPDSALYYFESQLQTSLLLSDYIAKASSLNNIAIALFKKKEYEKALNRYLESKQIMLDNKAKNSPNFNGEKESFYYSVLYNIGMCYYNMNKFSEALPYFEKTYLYERGRGNNNRIVTARSLISTYLHLKLLAKAKQVERSVTTRIDNYTNLGRFNLLSVQQELSLAEKNVEKAKSLALEIQKLQAKIDQEKAIETDRMNVVLSQFLISEEKIKLDIEKRKKQQLEKTVSLKKRENQLIVAISILILVVFIIIVSFYFQYARNKRRKIQLEKEYLELEDEKHKLKIKSQENFLTEFAIENNLKKEFSKELLKNLNHLISLNDEEIKKEIKNLIFDLKNKELSEKNVEELNNQSELLLINFKTKLSHIHPKLSKSDIDLCCLIKLNLSNKEIAIHKNVTDESVKIFKNRLKKKMGLDSSVNLNTYLVDL